MDRPEPTDEEPTGLLMSAAVTAALNTAGTADVSVVRLTVSAVVAAHDSSSTPAVPASSGV
jgi:hypothetical protein